MVGRLHLTLCNILSQVTRGSKNSEEKKWRCVLKVFVPTNSPKVSRISSRIGTRVGTAANLETSHVRPTIIAHRCEDDIAQFVWRTGKRTTGISTPATPPQKDLSDVKWLNVRMVPSSGSTVVHSLTRRHLDLWRPSSGKLCRTPLDRILCVVRTPTSEIKARSVTRAYSRERSRGSASEYSGGTRRVQVYNTGLLIDPGDPRRMMTM